MNRFFRCLREVLCLRCCIFQAGPPFWLRQISNASRWDPKMSFGRRFIFPTIKIYHENHLLKNQLSSEILSGGKICSTSRQSTPKTVPDSALEQWVPYRQMVLGVSNEQKIFKNSGILLKMYFCHDIRR